MHTYIINTTLLALCYSYNVSALKGPSPRERHWCISTAKSTKYVPDVKSSLLILLWKCTSHIP